MKCPPLTPEVHDRAIAYIAEQMACRLPIDARLVSSITGLTHPALGPFIAGIRLEIVLSYARETSPRHGLAGVPKSAASNLLRSQSAKRKIAERRAEQVA